MGNATEQNLASLYMGKPCAYCGRKIRSSYLWAVPFCTQTCAARFGILAYNAGYRVKQK